MDAHPVRAAMRAPHTCSLAATNACPASSPRWLARWPARRATRASTLVPLSVLAPSPLHQWSGSARPCSSLLFLQHCALFCPSISAVLLAAGGRLGLPGRLFPLFAHIYSLFVVELQQAPPARRCARRATSARSATSAPAPDRRPACRAPPARMPRCAARERAPTAGELLRPDMDLLWLLFLLGPVRMPSIAWLCESVLRTNAIRFHPYDVAPILPSMRCRSVNLVVIVFRRPGTYAMNGGQSVRSSFARFPRVLVVSVCGSLCLLCTPRCSHSFIVSLFMCIWQACDSCTPGYFADGTRSSACKPCVAGTISTTSGAVQVRAL
jgi:hypothetical protein